MFIAPSAAHDSLAPLGAKPGSERMPRQDKEVALLRSRGINKGLPAINVSPSWGEATNMFCCSSKLDPRVTDDNEKGKIEIEK